MKISELQQNGNNLNTTKPETSNQEEMAVEFEKLFARQLVQEMTKDLFKNDDNKGMMGMKSSGIYREHIIDTLSQELAEQGKLGMGKMIERYLDNLNQNH